MIDGRTLGAARAALVAGLLLVVGAGVGAELARASGSASALIDTLSLSQEGNVPTWYSSMLLFSCALALAACGARAEPLWRFHWRGLAALFAAMSLDEVASFHERLNQFASIGGVFTFAWVIPFGALVLIVGLVCVPFLRALPAQTSRRFIAAGALYVGGALGVELVLGGWMSAHGSNNLTYFMIDAVEEAAEIAGASLFLASLLAHLTHLATSDARGAAATR